MLVCLDSSQNPPDEVLLAWVEVFSRIGISLLFTVMYAWVRHIKLKLLNKMSEQKKLSSIFQAWRIFFRVECALPNGYDFVTSNLVDGIKSFIMK